VYASTRNESYLLEEIKMTDTIQLSKECGYKDLPTVRLAYQGFNLEAFRSRIEDEMREKIIQEHDFFRSEVWLADSIRSMK